MKKKIFIGPCEISGYYSNLAKGFNELGHGVDFFTYNNHKFDYGGENPPFLIKIANFFNDFKKNKRRNFVVLISILIGEFFSLIWAITAIFKYDIFIFGFGQSLIRFNIDLYILKLLNKTIISNLAHGSEARPVYLDGFIRNSDSGKFPSMKKILQKAKTTKKLVSRHEKLATYIIGAPFSSSHFSSQKFINHFDIGIPNSACNLKNKFKKSDSSKVIRILHSPSHVIGKGTSVIEKAILNLQKKGYLIDFILLKGVPNLEVIKEIKKCDFIVDQIYSDTPLASFATEAAFLGKPSVVGGYGFEYLKKFISPEMFPPSKLCKPNQIEAAIESLLISEKKRLTLGESAKNFVDKNWNSKEVAKRYLRIIEGDIPETWWLDPKEVFYIEGCGQPFNITKCNIKKIIREYGIDKLHLNHNPKLEEVFLKFSK